MNQEFAENIKNHIREYLPVDYQDAKITLEKVTKGNDRILTGLIIRKDDETAVPSIYLEHYEEQFGKRRAGGHDDPWLRGTLGAAVIRYFHGYAGTWAETLCPQAAKETAGGKSQPAENQSSTGTIGGGLFEYQYDHNR